ncbi:SRPBCC family protein [Marinilabilia sp.]
MAVFKSFIVEVSTPVFAPADQIWDFLKHLEKNYQKWHPKDHFLWRWTKGQPLKAGSEFYCTGKMDDHQSRIKGKIYEAVLNQKVIIKPFWPVSFLCPEIEWAISEKEKGALFTARTCYRFGWIYRHLAPGRVRSVLTTTRQHMEEEGRNMKKLLEP